MPYLLWEIYWADKVGYNCIKWHTRLMLYVYFWIAIYLVLYYLFYTINKLVYEKLITAFSSVIVVLMLVEFFLSCFRINETALERIGNGYNSWYHAEGESWYHTYPPNQSRWITKREYNYERIANSRGYSDPEWAMDKKNGEKRVLALGDSFTEGDGAPYDSSYVSQLRNRTKADSLVYLMNAGVCGSDPFINFVNYRDRLTGYQPDVILQTLSSGDINVDLIVRGGMERFLPGGKVQFKKGPWWEPIYALSFLSRFYFNALGYNQLLLRDADINARKNELDTQTIELFKSYAALAKKNNCRLVVVLQPFLGEVKSNQYSYDFSKIMKALNRIDNLKVVDLLPFYKTQITNRNTSPESFYWPLDGHHNGKGYAMMADGIYAALVTDSLFANNPNNSQ
ncbi:MAG: hypothetical protein NTY88_05930 [Bacteroidetes bacterium]|nr:hypothetical protein [Bacteroidota bacterium]